MSQDLQRRCCASTNSHSYFPPALLAPPPSPMAAETRHGRHRIEKKGTFTCESCSLSTPFHAFGRTCLFAKSLVLLEEAFIARDPFSPDPQPLILGSHCSVCNKVVCVSAACSVFYTKRFCIECVKNNLEEFPTEIRQELAQLQQRQESS